MLITLVCENKIFGLHLPEKVAGKYWITDEDRPVNKQKILGIEGDEENGVWFIRSVRKKVELFGEQGGGRVDRLILNEGHLYRACIGNNAQERALIFTEAFTADRCSFTSYAIPQDITINIGRTPENDICINNPYVSSNHAQITFHKDAITITDGEKTNGTYVNQKRVIKTQKLIPGDVVFILGFKLIIGAGFIAINNPGNCVTLNSGVFKLFIKNEAIDSETIDLEEEKFYYRSPRFIKQIDTFTMKVDMPPNKEKNDDLPLVVTMLPAMMMGVASFSSGLITTINTMNNGGKILASLPTMLMSVSMLAGMVIFPFIMKSLDKKRKKAKEENRRKQYTKYLNTLRREIEIVSKQQEDILRENSPSILTEINGPDFWVNKLWSKTTNHEDFLFLRLGLGNARMNAEIDFPEERFSIDDDVMRTELSIFKDEERLLTKIPLGVSLCEEHCVGIVGKADERAQVINNLLTQIYAMHSYDEVKTVFICENRDVSRFKYVKWAQHSWDNDGKYRFFASTEDDLRELSNTMNSIINRRKEAEEEEAVPHYVIVSFSNEMSNKCAFISEILKNEQLPGFSVIMAYEDTSNLPKECEAIVEVEKGVGQLYKESEPEMGHNGFIPDIITSEQAESIVRRMSGYCLDLQQGRYALPGMLTFLDMFGVGKIEHLNILRRWKSNNPIMTLKTPVGVDTNGETFYLDLHEKFHGPHGLVAGMTGSGKSEFIITYILSLAVNYHPDEVAFVLIDYKGGGLTGAFENEKVRLPHLAGTITNLDGGAITRTIYAIESEQKRRQSIFNKAKNLVNEGTMDIYKYQKMYRDGLVTEPMPHLFIISDEFAELKAQQPEFMDQLISTARVGRSLGIHLILATQKPAGVVNDQIWANSKFKVCLKVQDRADSMEMLKKPDAAEIVETGRFYLQVGYDEIFELGQSAWCGAPYKESDVVQEHLDGNIEILDNHGNVVDKIKSAGNSRDVDKENGKQNIRILEYLDQLAKQERLQTHQLWLPPIPGDISLDYVKEKYKYQTVAKNEYVALVGELDNPYNQSQEYLEVNLVKNGNFIVYGAAGTGKEMFLTTMLFSLYSNYTANELNTYIIDFGSETLKAFEGAPQTSGVMLDGENERIENMFAIIGKEIKHRKKAFSEYGGDFGKYNEQAEEKAPAILVVINSFANFIDSYEKYEEVLLSLTRDCNKYGIYFVLTALTTNAVRYRLAQNFGSSYVMQLNDKSDYISLLGTTGGVYPNKNKGCGIIKKDKTYVFQTARITSDESDFVPYVKAFCKSLTSIDGIGKAKQIPVVPKFISSGEWKDKCKDLSKVPIGMNRADYEDANIDLTVRTVLSILAIDGNDATKLTMGMIDIMSAVPDAEFIVFNPADANQEKTNVPITYIREGYDAEINRICDLAIIRNNNYKDTDGHPDVDMHPIIVVFNKLGDYVKKFSADADEAFTAMLDRVEKFWNIVFIIPDSVNNSGEYFNASWCRNKVHGNGLWIGNGVDNQTKLSIYNKSKELGKKIEDNDGYIIEDGSVISVRFALPEAYRKEEDDE